MTVLLKYLNLDEKLIVLLYITGAMELLYLDAGYTVTKAFCVFQCTGKF